VCSSLSDRPSPWVTVKVVLIHSTGADSMGSVVPREADAGIRGGAMSAPWSRFDGPGAAIAPLPGSR
jgi:hypothetical protein